MARQVRWSEESRADIRALDKTTATRVHESITRFAATGQGDIKRLKGAAGELRLRVGDWRVRFSYEPDGSILIHTVRHRREADR
ncbi:MAG: type II toxin-antitoxin system RelE/ParE family toxin [Acidobacteriota bacterium]